MQIKLSEGELRKSLCAVCLTLVCDNLFVKSPGPIAFKLPIVGKDSQIQNQAKFFFANHCKSADKHELNTAQYANDQQILLLLPSYEVENVFMVSPSIHHDMYRKVSLREFSSLVLSIFHCWIEEKNHCFFSRQKNSMINYWSPEALQRYPKLL